MKSVGKSSENEVLTSQILNYDVLMNYDDWDCFRMMNMTCVNVYFELLIGL